MVKCEEGNIGLKNLRATFINESNKGNYEVEKQEKKIISESINRIMNTLSFRKLSGKTQVILSLSGPDVRTRLTHTVEVARISRDICEKLGLNADLAEAIALAHDIGHTPFGHAGERTLKEIMCGCDTLDDGIIDLDFPNSGFKHNLQGFRVLRDIERIALNDNEIGYIAENERLWQFILWGVINHTDPTYAKPNLTMDNEIYISCAHCEWVYSCYLDKDNKCKRNKSVKKNDNKKGVICKPWYCSKLEKEKWKKKYTQCGDEDEDEEEERCYLAQLWSYKQSCQNYRRFRYLFDHPFPNSFYFQCLHDFFFKDGHFKDCVSIEAHIVKLADEIAQRQQDLEDGIKKKLINATEAQIIVKDLFKGFKDDQGLGKNFIKYLLDINLENPDFQQKVGKLLVDFYQQLLIQNTKKNFNYILLKEREVKISYYCLLKILNSILKIDEGEWLLKEVDDFISNTNYSQKVNDNQNFFFDSFKNYFSEIDTSEAYLYILLYELLESKTKDGNDFEALKDIHNKLVDLEKELALPSKEKDESKARNGEEVQDIDEKVKILKDVDKAKQFLKGSRFLEQYSKDYRQYNQNIHGNTSWKNLKDLNLNTFDKLFLFAKSLSDPRFPITTISFDSSTIDNSRAKEKEREVYEIVTDWKDLIKLKANEVFANLVSFVELKDEGRKEKETFLEEFQKTLSSTILKSEIVEKNDGKASFILRQLFKAYIKNPHQLTDDCLRNIIIDLKGNEKKQDSFIKDNNKVFKGLLNDLKGALPPDYESDKKKRIEKIINSTINYSQELKKLIEYFKVITNKELKEIENIYPRKVDINTEAFIKKVSKIIKEIKKEIEEGGHGHGSSNKISTPNNEIIAGFQDSYKQYDDIEKPTKLPKEIKDLLLKKEDLDKFYYYLTINNLKTNSEYSRKQVKKFRRIIDNPLLNAIPFWKSILTRGICDYIAGMTDQEAINEYEKLYTGVMELV